MSQAPKKSARPPSQRGDAASPSQAEFDEVLALIDAAKARAFAAVNTTLIELYWNIGQHISRKIAEERLGPGDRRSPGRNHPAAISHDQGLLRTQPLADDAVLRDLLRTAKTLTAGARIVLDPQPADHESVQAAMRNENSTSAWPLGNVGHIGSSSVSSTAPCSSAWSCRR